MKKITMIPYFPFAKIIHRPKFIETIKKDALPFLSTNKETEVIMDAKAIKTYNETILKKTEALYNVDAIETLTKEEIKKKILIYNLPVPAYNNNKPIPKKVIKQILENQNLEQIKSKEKLPQAIVVKRSNLKSFPTTLHFFKKPNETKVEQLQLTALSVNTPLRVLHESKDHNWVFVISPIYAGWIQKENIAYAADKDIKYFIQNKKFAVVVASKIEIEDTVLDMGVTLPYKNFTKKGYCLILPVKNEDGFVRKKEILISKDKVHMGYLPYNKRNVILQAFQYKGTSYQWGGMDKDVDCSSYISNLYKTFGFLLPRDTSSQKESIGRVIPLKGTSQEKKEILKKYKLGFLYQPGHVMLYIGTYHNVPYIIHASQTATKVVDCELKEPNLSLIDRLVLLP